MECGLQPVQLAMVIKQNVTSSYLLLYLFIFSVVDCGSLVAPANGQVDSSNTSRTIIGSVFTFACHTGYILSHQEEIICGTDGMWSPETPSCLGEL